MTITSPIDFADYYAGLRKRTMRIAELLPEDRIEERIPANAFSAGDLLRHLALIERNLYVETIRGGQGAYFGCGPEFASGKANILAFVSRLHEESLEIIRALPVERLNEKCMTLAGTPITVWKWMRAATEHEIHHRGQLYVYLAQFGVKAPPLFGLSAEEVEARSRAAYKS
jgi:uncharacterized damage-inducible protein DinB